MVPLLAGLDLLEQATIAAVRAKSVALTGFALELTDAWLAPLGVRVAAPRAAERRGGHLTIQRPGFRAVLDELWARGVLPDYREPDGIRLGPGPAEHQLRRVAPRPVGAAGPPAGRVGGTFRRRRYKSTGKRVDVVMTAFGFHASHEQVHPSALLAAVQHAEQAGFDAAMSSDHFSPWSARQGESAFAWSWLGAALQATALAVRRGERARPALPPGDHRAGHRHPGRHVPRPVLGRAGHRRGQQRAHHRRPVAAQGGARRSGCASAWTSSGRCCAARRSATTGWSGWTGPGCGRVPRNRRR